MNRASGIFQLLRFSQWLKNLFVFLPLFFSGHLFHWHQLFETCVAFLSFSLAASSIYCLNDIVDREADRLHPEKRKRPVASGQVGVKAAYAMMAVTFLGALGIMMLIPEPGQRWWSMGIVGGYWLLNVAYCLKLKQVSLIDVTVIAVGFVLRVVCGGMAAGIMVSQWIVIMTFLLALFLAFCKRRDDLRLYESTGQVVRKNIVLLNTDFVDQTISLLGTITIVAYIIYTLSDEVTRRFQTESLYITSIFVLLGILRYMQLTIVDKSTGSPTKVLRRDLFTQLCVAGWIVSFLLIIYL